LIGFFVGVCFDFFDFGSSPGVLAVPLVLAVGICFFFEREELLWNWKRGRQMQLVALCVASGSQAVRGRQSADK
jgi:hypothetical protein